MAANKPHMKIVALTSSPRSNGNTNALMNELLRGVQESDTEICVERFDLCKMNIHPCIHCDGCHRAGQCVINDDMQTLYPLITETDWLVLSSPIYYMAHSAQAKCFIDRCQAFWARRYILKQNIRDPELGPRRGVFISVGATRGPKVFAGSLITMKWLYDSLQMVSWADLIYDGVDHRGKIKEHEIAMQESFQTGQKIAQISQENK